MTQETVFQDGEHAVLQVNSDPDQAIVPIMPLHGVQHRQGVLL